MLSLIGACELKFIFRKYYILRLPTDRLFLFFSLARTFTLSPLKIGWNECPWTWAEARASSGRGKIHETRWLTYIPIASTVQAISNGPNILSAFTRRNFFQIQSLLFSKILKIVSSNYRIEKISFHITRLKKFLLMLINLLILKMINVDIHFTKTKKNSDKLFLKVTSTDYNDKWVIERIEIQLVNNLVNTRVFSMEFQSCTRKQKFPNDCNHDGPTIRNEQDKGGRNGLNE